MKKNPLLRKAFWRSLLWKQNKHHRHGMLLHTLRVAWIATIIAKNESNADLAKVVKMALVHDIAESRTGDTHYL